MVRHSGRLLPPGERYAIAAVVEHLAEVDKRDLHLKRGCSSLTRYCEERLRYSDRAAARRVAAARLSQRHPIILGMLRRGETTLSNLQVLSPVLKAPSDEAKLLAAAGKTRTEVERMVVGWSPRDVFEANLVRTKVDTAPRLLEQLIEERRQASVSVEPAVERPTLELPRAPLPKPVTVEFSELHCCIPVESERKLLALRDHYRHSIPDGDIAKVIAKAIDEAYDKVMARKLGKLKKPKSQQAQLLPPEEVAKKRRAPDQATRREVSERDGYRCCFTAEDGHQVDTPHRRTLTKPRTNISRGMGSSS